MTKLEKVLYSLARCSCQLSDACMDCAYHESTPVCWVCRKWDALGLLKELEPVKPKEVNMYPRGQYACGFCGYRLQGVAKYCGQCGRAVKWDE